MDSLHTRKDKINLIKGLLNGGKSLHHELRQKVYTVYSVAQDMHMKYTGDGEILTEEEKERLTKETCGRAVIWVNIVYTESNSVICLPHNHRRPIPEPIYKSFSSNEHLKP